MASLIEPRVLKGFRDLMPEAEIERKDLQERLERVFRAYGFVPIDTPSLEYADVLLGKSGGDTEKQIYRFKDHGNRDIALRFDLTVPLARFVAEHAAQLAFPFKRYHIGKVWRGENTQRGRYREFMQCDFDIVGSDAASADFEIAATIASSMKALEVGGYTIRFNHRGVFNAFLERIGAKDKAIDLLRLIDKLDKIGIDEVKEQVTKLVGPAADDVLAYVARDDSFAATLDRIERLSGGPSDASGRIKEIMECAEGTGIGARLRLDPAIMRGHDYYTGIVFETYLDDLPDIGQVCGGGRYDDLASLYTKQRLPGVGASVGIDRLIAALDELGRSRKRGGYALAMVFRLEEGFSAEYQNLAASIRERGICCEVFPERKKIQQQFAYAEKKGIRYGVMRGTDEQSRGVYILKDLRDRDSVECASIESLIARLESSPS